MPRRRNWRQALPKHSYLFSLLRGWQLLATTVVLVVAVIVIAPQQAGLIVYKAGLITGAAYLAYLVDRVIYPNARPDSAHLSDWEAVHAQYRRAIIIASAMLAAGLAA